MTQQKVFMPFRLRDGGDPGRGINLEVAQAWWYGHGYDPVIVSDEGQGNAPFDRNRAYNIAVRDNPECETYIFAEADLLVHPDQISIAVQEAQASNGVVIPFSEVRYIGSTVTTFIWDTFHSMSTKDLAKWWALPATDINSVFDMRSDSTRKNSGVMGSTHVVSRNTLLDVGGYSEALQGFQYNDQALGEGFTYLTKKIREAGGPALHLYHEQDEDEAESVERNEKILTSIRRMARAKDKTGVRRMMKYRR